MYDIICKMCGKKFKAQERYRKYCNIKCKDFAGKNRYKLKCENCEREFSNSVKRRFCSVKCSNSISAQKRKTLVTKKCLKCGKEYEIQQHRVKEGKKYFCSDICRMSWNTRIKKICKCGKEFEVFIGRKDKAIYCSNECKWKYMFDGRRTYDFRDKTAVSKDRLRGKFLYGNKCELCDWDKLVEVHHIDSNRNNHEDSNLCVLCPNCHTLTEPKYEGNEHYVSEEKMKEMIKNVRTRRNEDK